MMMRRPGSIPFEIEGSKEVWYLFPSLRTILVVWKVKNSPTLYHKGDIETKKECNWQSWERKTNEDQTMLSNVKVSFHQPFKQTDKKLVGK